ncbi:nSTAND1 domain-containing NTPase [Kangiella shandongensis]|uniref:nSTAND1 domain-containing NTPase n=1 Tax=Kangiella shandongensis TaxID=2763258 RepID=UPI001CBFFA66|nr:winged helix-turn-helix domain-containing protein [Kangiella shandongensis]
MGKKMIQIGDWLVQPDTNKFIYATNQAKQLTIEPKNMDVLLCLIEKAGDVVPSSIIIDRCWPNQFLSDNPLHKSIANLRKSLGDKSKDPQYIQTIPKRGYKLVAAVQHLSESAPQLSDTVAPYPGPRAFNIDESHLFFGRDYDIQQLCGYLTQPNTNSHWPQRNTLLIGDSSQGKTSLIHAGIRSKLLNTGIELLVFDGDEVNDSNLAHAFNAFLAQVDSKAAGSFIICIDHIDFTKLLPISAAINNPPFLNKLENLISSNTTPVLLSINYKDFHAIHYSGKYSALANSHRYELKSPNRTELHQIIHEPAKLSGLSLGYDHRTNTSLTDRLVNDVLKNNLDLKRLQEILHRLLLYKENNSISHHSYIKIKQKEPNLLQPCGLPLLEQLTDSKDVIYQLLSHLITVKFDGQFHIAIKSLNLNHIDSGEMLQVIHKLIEQKLLVCNIQHNQVSVRFYRKSLIHKWNLSQRWITTNYSNLIAEEHITTNCELWLKHNKGDEWLLGQGKALEEARYLMKNSHKLAEETQEYIEKSINVISRKKWYKNVMIAFITSLSLISLAALFIANDARLQQKSARASAENLISFMNQELKKELVPVGKLDLLANVGTKILNYYNQTKISDSTAKFHVALAQKLLGEVYSQQGRFDKARSLFNKTETTLKQVISINHGSTRAKMHLGQTYYWIGYLEYLENNYSNAQKHWQQYYNLAHTLYNQEPTNKEYLKELSYAHNNLGTISLYSGKAQEALPHFKKSAKLKKLFLSKELDQNVQIEYLDTLSWIARVYKDMGDTFNSKQQYSNQLQTLSKLPKKVQSQKNYQYYKAAAHQNLAELEYLLSNYNSSLHHINESKLLLKKLITFDPSNIEYKESMVFSMIHLGTIFRLQQKFDKATIQYEEALSLLNSLTKGQKTDVATLYSAKINYELGRYHQQLNHEQSARYYFNKSLDYVRNNSSSKSMKHLYGLNLLRLGEMDTKSKKQEQAETLLNKALEEYRGLTANNKSIAYMLPYCLLSDYLETKSTAPCSGQRHLEYINNLNPPKRRK